MYSFLYFLCILVLVEVKSFYLQNQKPIYLITSAGDHVVFTCKIDFPQNLPIAYKITLKKEGKTIYSWYNGIGRSIDPFIGRVNLVNHSINGHHYGRASVNLTSIRNSDSGWFQCKIYFPNRTPNSQYNGTWYYLAVNSGKLLALPPINQTVLEGEAAKFVCLTKSTDLRVTWYKDGILLKKFYDLLRRSYITKEKTLIIRSTIMGDDGEYKCEISKFGREKQTATAFLNVQYKAKVIFTPPEITLSYGLPGLIDCHFRANPPLTNIRWTKDGYFLDPYNIKNMFYRRNGSLYFTKVDERHTGSYSCTPFNKLGTQGPSPAILVKVQRPPVFIIVPQNSYLGKFAGTITIPCDARDDKNGHKPIIVWRKMEGGSPVERYLIQEENLTIFNLQEEDSGKYQCSAVNAVATITAETELLVEKFSSSEKRNSTKISSDFSVHLIT